MRANPSDEPYTPVSLVTPQLRSPVVSTAVRPAFAKSANVPLVLDHRLDRCCRAPRLVQDHGASGDQHRHRDRVPERAAQRQRHECDRVGVEAEGRRDRLQVRHGLRVCVHRDLGKPGGARGGEADQRMLGLPGSGPGGLDHGSVEQVTPQAMRHHVVAGDVFHDERDGAIEGVEELGAIEAEELVGDKGGVDFGYPGQVIQLGFTESGVQTERTDSGTGRAEGKDRPADPVRPEDPGDSARLQADSRKRVRDPGRGERQSVACSSQRFWLTSGSGSGRLHPRSLHGGGRGTRRASPVRSTRCRHRWAAAASAAGFRCPVRRPRPR